MPRSADGRAGLRVKICGLKTPETVAAAVAGGAAYLGFVFFPRSPRAVTPEAAATLAAAVPPGLMRVALLVDPDDALLDAVLAPGGIDMLQLHGHETPERVAAVRARTGLPVMKAVGIAGEDDLPAIAAAEAAADQILVDAKPAPGATRPGGNGLAFDWRLLAGRRWSRPWMLSGGLTAATVAEAARLTGAAQVDVSSGVESSPGEKDPGLIRAFLAAAAE